MLRDIVSRHECTSLLAVSELMMAPCHCKHFCQELACEQQIQPVLLQPRSVALFLSNALLLALTFPKQLCVEAALCYTIACGSGHAQLSCHAFVLPLA